MDNHSPEPWETYGGDRRTGIKSVFRPIVYSDGGTSPADARRIVSCVNACQGISTEDLERVGDVVLGKVGRCKTCKHWDVRTCDPEEIENIGSFECRASNVGFSPVPLGWIETCPDFGCIHHKEKT